MKLNYSSITQFQQHVDLKDYRVPTKKEYVRNLRKLAEHFQCDPATPFGFRVPRGLRLKAPGCSPKQRSAANNRGVRRAVDSSTSKRLRPRILPLTRTRSIAHPTLVHRPKFGTHTL